MQAGGGGDNEVTESRRTRFLLRAVVWTMLVLSIASFLASMLDTNNRIAVTLGFYSPLFVILPAMLAMIHRGYVETSAWILSVSFWLLIAFVTLFFGGLQGANSAAFAVSTVLAGTLIGGRAALAFAASSSVWVWLLVWLERNDAMPPQIGSYSAINSATALTTTLVLLSVLVRWTIDSLRDLNQRARIAARERDEALIRSIHSQKLELVGGLTGGIAHDFNNLLMVITSASESLRLRAQPDDRDTHEILDDLDAASVRAVLMTRQLLSFSRPPDGDLAAVDVSRVARALEPMLPRLLGPKVVISVVAAPTAGVRATRAGLEQVLLNLAVNARDAMPSGGTLTIDVTADEADVTLRVSDTGVGMNDAVRARIFEAFYTTKSAGTGLGLATVRELVARYHGVIEVHSVVGTGTTFSLRFPRDHTADAAPTPAPVVARAAAMRARVLLVEDDALVRRSLLRILETAGYDVVTVTDGLEALGLLERVADFAVVVSDIAMPGLDGEALARRLADVHPNLPVVLLSGHIVPTTDSLASKRRAYLPKPATVKALLDAIERVCAAPTSGG